LRRKRSNQKGKKGVKNLTGAPNKHARPSGIRRQKDAHYRTIRSGIMQRAT
jgi:hypothetical protein